MGKVILVSSGKGGTGKTMFSVNLGALLAEKRLQDHITGHGYGTA